MSLVNTNTRELLARNNPDVAKELENLQRVIDESELDAGLLKLCGDFIEATLRGSGWTPPDSMSELDEACIKVCEQFITSVSSTSEEQIAALRAHLSTDDVYNLMYAIYLIETSKRLDLTLERVLL